MNFKEWCKNVYGITYFSEGKITNKVLLPARFRASVKTNSLIEHFGGHPIATSEEHGLVFTKENYDLLIERLRVDYSHNGKYRIEEEKFQKWKARFFDELGVDVTQGEKEYRTCPRLHVTLNSATTEENFLAHFAHLNPHVSTNPITGLLSVEMPSSFIDELYGLYYKGQYSAIQTCVDSRQLETHKKELQQLQQDIEKHKLHQRLDKARKLALDYGNSKNNIGNKLFEAASSYAISLKAFAVINKDNLSYTQYTDLLYASKLLADYDAQGSLQQSLKTDSNFVDHIVHRVYETQYLSDSSQERTVIRDLPSIEQRHLRQLIDTNASNLLYGASGVSLGKGQTFTMKRFFPDAYMQSETDTIILQAGGVQGHSTMVELVKVGRLADGSLAGPHQRPYYYDYYKVDHDLGYGLHEANDRDGTSLGTYVTKLEPYTVNERGQFIPYDVNPRLDPHRYQQAMEFTLHQLIITEREALFYRPPGTTNEDAPIGSREANEFERLTRIRNLLSGRPYDMPIAYTVSSGFSQPYQRIIRNEKGYSQQSGSCTIFSIKGLVNSIIGHELATLHADFMQTHTGKDYVVTLQNRMAYIDRRMSELRAIEAKRQVPVHPTFFSPPAPKPRLEKQGLEILQGLSLPGAKYISVAMKADDIYKPGKKVIKLMCSSLSEAHKLCDVIESLTTRTPALTVTREGHILLGENRIRALCEKLGLNKAYLMGSLPNEEELVQESHFRPFTQYNRL